MNRFFSVAAVVVLALSIGAVGFGPGVAAGQESAGNATATATPTTSSTPTSTPTPASSGRTETSSIGTETPTEPSDDEEEDNATGDRLDSSVVLTDWTFSEGSFTLTFENTDRRPTWVTISGSTQPQEGVSTFNIREERLLPGRTTITMKTHVNDGEAAISVTSDECIDTETCIKISTGSPGDDPFRHFGGTSGLLSGTFGTMGMGGFAAAFVVWREETGVIEA